ncbi:MarR family transcriptional regulator [Anabaena sp. CCY 0017]|uniref:MarR family transcriptional regulator n=1 Tax=Anabaena sp. CCY 0017 TaxID=3103866 RepID=UPI0039C7379F
MKQISGKFYPLQRDEWLKACKELTPRELQVLYYLRTTDPYSNSFQISAAQIARDLSTNDKKVHRQTISRALKSLDAKGFIDIELIEIQVNITPKGYWCNECISTVSGHTTLDHHTPGAIATHHPGSPHTTLDHHTPGVIATHQAQSETLAQQESHNSKINKTYLDFIDSLSEQEREEFLKFGEQKAAQLPHPPQLPRRWIETNWQELSAQWYKSKGQSSPAQNSKWETDPRRQEWLDKIRSLGFAAFICENGSLDKQRKEFYQWANSHNLIWGDEI